MAPPSIGNNQQTAACIKSHDIDPFCRIAVKIEIGFPLVDNFDGKRIRKNRASPAECNAIMFSNVRLGLSSSHSNRTSFIATGYPYLSQAATTDGPSAEAFIKNAKIRPHKNPLNRRPPRLE